MSSWFNGQSLSFANRQIETTPDHHGDAEPTAVINEPGTGGLLGPVEIDRES